MLASVSSSRPKRIKRSYNEKEKKFIKLIKNDSEIDGDESEHELSFYMKDRVKLMKEVLKIIKPKKIRSMAPECMRSLDNEEINSRLLEELLGISDKRLRYIFAGQNLNEDSSSTDPEAEDETIDLISLDDISDGDLVIDLDSDQDRPKKPCRRKMKIKEEHRKKRVKKERPDKHKNSKSPQEPISNKTSEENLMSVLELLELQARARAIKSQLVLEKQQEQEKQRMEIADDDSDNDAVIVESPRNDEIVISSSDGEDDQHHNSENREETVDFWCGAKGKESDISELVKENGIDHIHQPQLNTDGETPHLTVHEKDVSTNNSDAQSCSDLNKKSELVELRNIPLPQQGTVINNEKTIDNDNEEGTIKCQIVESADDKISQNVDQSIRHIGKSAKDQEETMKSTETKLKEAKENNELITENKPIKNNHEHNEKLKKVSSDKKKLDIPKKSKDKGIKMEDKERGNSSDDEERIVLNVEQSELDSVNLD